MPRPTQRQIWDKRVDIAAADTFREEQAARERARHRADIASGADTETRDLSNTLTKHKVARVVVPDGDGDGPTPWAQWGDAYPRASVNARINERSRDIAAAIARDGRSEDWEAVVPPELVDVPVTAHHPTAGLLRLRCDGDGWWVNVRGTLFGCGSVTASERQHDEDGAATFVPRPEVLEQAARAALAHPEGAEAPDELVFVGDPDAPDGVRARIGPEPEPETTFPGLRARIAARMMRGNA